ncbi:hypothetical protein Goarm_023059 [Gossypium armourianum]|uniref:Uncharacterized protein n=1 Tax=Gossypium armourianum TaxID=34283 RepID=A0A7J9KHB1_9ROSI|nr:hypothetical protein [Gossypium armourianum]
MHWVQRVFSSTSGEALMLMNPSWFLHWLNTD